MDTSGPRLHMGHYTTPRGVPETDRALLAFAIKNKPHAFKERPVAWVDDFVRFALEGYHLDDKEMSSSGHVGPGTHLAPGMTKALAELRGGTVQGGAASPPGVADPAPGRLATFAELQQGALGSSAVESALGATPQGLPHEGGPLAGRAPTAVENLGYFALGSPYVAGRPTKAPNVHHATGISDFWGSSNAASQTQRPASSPFDGASGRNVAQRSGTVSPNTAITGVPQADRLPITFPFDTPPQPAPNTSPLPNNPDPFSGFG